MNSTNWIPSFTIIKLLPEYYPDGHLLNGILSVNTWKGGNAAIRNTIWILAMMKGKEKLSAIQKRGGSIGCWMLRVSYKNSTICRMSWYRWIQNLYESYVLVGYHNLQSMLYLIYFCLKDILKFLHQKIFPRRWKVKTKIFSTMSCNVEGTSFKLLEKGLSTYFFSHLELIKSFSSLANCTKVLNG